jgi:Resolvase, N terminal domain
MNSRNKTAPSHHFSSEAVRSLSPFWSSLLSCVGLVTVTMGPSHLRPLILLDQQLIIVASSQPFPYQAYGRAAFFPASRSEDQSLPWGKCCLLSISQGGNCAHHQIISCQIALPRIPRGVTVSRERVALFLLWANPEFKKIRISVSTLVVTELSRLGRSTPEVITLVNELVARNIRVMILKQNLDIHQHDMNSKIVITLFSLFAELERDLISLRTKEALFSRVGFLVSPLPRLAHC